MQPDENMQPDSTQPEKGSGFSSKESPLLAPIEALVGTQLDQYFIHREIGRGSMGVVFEAEHQETNQRVALKVLPLLASPCIWYSPSDQKFTMYPYLSSWIQRIGYQFPANIL